MSDLETSDYSYIYSFVSRNKNDTLYQRLFYDGSSGQMDVRLEDHIKRIFENSSEDKYKYINSVVGVNGFDIYIIDKVPTNLQFSW